MGLLAWRRGLAGPQALALLAGGAVAVPAVQPAPAVAGVLAGPAVAGVLPGRAVVGVLPGRAVVGALPGRAASGWSAPTPVAPPSPLDIVPAQIGFSAGGSAAISFGVQDEDDPADVVAQVVQRSAAGGVSAPHAVPSAQAVLALAFDGPTLELLTASSPAGAACCSTAQAVPLTARGTFGRSTTLVSELTGATLGRLVALPGGRLLAAVASEDGVWVAQSARDARFAPARRLTTAGEVPQSLAASALSGGATVVAWTAANTGEPGARQVFAAAGSLLAAPRRASAVVTVPAGHQVQELALTGRPGVATVAWIESWFDRQGRYHAQPVVADLLRRPQSHPFPDGAHAASGLTIAGDARGDQVLAWAACTSAGSCSVMAARRPAGRDYESPVRLGAIDASQSPVATISSGGEALVGWIAGGQVHVAARGATARAFGPAQVVSSTNLASDLALSFGPGREAIAVWTEGLVAPTVLEAVYRVG